MRATKGDRVYVPVEEEEPEERRYVARYRFDSHGVDAELEWPGVVAMGRLTHRLLPDFVGKIERGFVEFSSDNHDLLQSFIVDWFWEMGLRSSELERRYISPPYMS